MQMLKLISVSIGVLSLCAMPATAEAPWCAYKSNGGIFSTGSGADPLWSPL
jgi:hypothetical protein